ncbi:S24 family peptidase [Halomonas halodenitrificans]|uniref:S24 family peptidase n=1 Tax=Halomonas halodenitrificans TaxID=28252 RepID=UPI0012EB3D96|nr:S24 family peptidase [Halomonas halodenitrificans]
MASSSRRAAISPQDSRADGGRVLVDRSSRDPHPEGMFLLLVHGKRRIKRVQRVAGDAWLLISDNPRYEKELIKPQDMRDMEILGRCEIRIGRVL